MLEDKGQGRGPHVLLCACGGIAAYKAVEVLRLLQRAGCTVRVASTEGALRFVGRATWEGLTHTPLATDLFAHPESAIPHVDLAGWADAVLVMPATANVMAKQACGLADDLVSATLLAVPEQTPVVVAPAMNVHMWQAPATQANVRTLGERGVRMVMPVRGRLACDDVGEGKLAPVEDIANAVLLVVGSRAQTPGTEGPIGEEPQGLQPLASEPVVTSPDWHVPAEPDENPQGLQPLVPASIEELDAFEPQAFEPAESLEAEQEFAEAAPMTGLCVLVTAGPTHEAIDPVRYIANASSGKMGYAIAAEAARRGAQVTLVSGPVVLPTPAGVQRVDVVSAAQMRDAAVAAFAYCDVAVCAAAVADYTPAHPADHKLKKSQERLDVIELVQTADILAELSASKLEGDRRRVVVGFAAETNDLERNAMAKLERKGCDLIVANDVSRADSGFGSDTNHVSLVSASGVEELPTMDKDEVASHLLDRIANLL